MSRARRRMKSTTDGSSMAGCGVGLQTTDGDAAGRGGAGGGLQRLLGLRARLAGLDPQIDQARGQHGRRRRRSPGRRATATPESPPLRDVGDAAVLGSGRRPGRRSRLAGSTRRALVTGAAGGSGATVVGPAPGGRPGRPAPPSGRRRPSRPVPGSGVTLGSSATSGLDLDPAVHRARVHDPRMPARRGPASRASRP